MPHVGCKFAWQRVTCSYCGRTYQCTPDNDFYCVDARLVGGDEEKHACEACLLDLVGMKEADVIIMPIDTTGGTQP